MVVVSMASTDPRGDGADVAQHRLGHRARAPLPALAFQHPFDQGAVEDQVAQGGGGMPAFEGQLSEEEIQNVAAFVVANEDG